MHELQLLWLYKTLQFIFSHSPQSLWYLFLLFFWKRDRNLCHKWKNKGKNVHQLQFSLLWFSIIGVIRDDELNHVPSGWASSKFIKNFSGVFNSKQILTQIRPTLTILWQPSWSTLSLCASMLQRLEFTKTLISLHYNLVGKHSGWTSLHSTQDTRDPHQEGDRLLKNKKKQKNI